MHILWRLSEFYSQYWGIYMTEDDYGSRGTAIPALLHDDEGNFLDWGNGSRLSLQLVSRDSLQVSLICS